MIAEQQPFKAQMNNTDGLLLQAEAAINTAKSGAQDQPSPDDASTSSNSVLSVSDSLFGEILQEMRMRPGEHL